MSDNNKATQQTAAPANETPLGERTVTINKRERNWVILAIEIFFVIFLPPVTALMERGCGIDFVLNIILTICGWIPGMIHAIYLIIVGKGNVDVEQGSGQAAPTGVSVNASTPANAAKK